MIINNNDGYNTNNVNSIQNEGETLKFTIPTDYSGPPLKYFLMNES